MITRPYESVPFQSAIFDAIVEHDPRATLMPDVVTEAIAWSAKNIISIQGKESLRILELGSGCAPFVSFLAGATPSHVAVELICVDNDSRAEAYGRYNVEQVLRKRKNERDTLTYINGDYLKLTLEVGLNDVVYFNPPYLQAGEPVRRVYEVMPAQSMFSEGDGLQHYRQMSRALRRSLRSGGLLCIRTPADKARHDTVRSIIESVVEPTDTIHTVHAEAELSERAGRGLIVEGSFVPPRHFEFGFVRTIGFYLKNRD